jgi:RimJ/RimL family protein N-acetyltransferase
MDSSSTGVLLRPWSEEDLGLMHMLLGDPEVMAHLGGPETPEQIERRHQRYLHLPEEGVDHMFKITWGPDAEAVGQIGYWKKNWRDRLVYEMGWMVLPSYQGRGIATQAGQLILERARSDRRFPFMHAFPSVSNPASNAICRKLGFTLLEECQFEYPPGHSMLVNDWQLEL